jgi:sugar lactone lactonase YvrE
MEYAYAALPVGMVCFLAIGCQPQEPPAAQAEQAPFALQMVWELNEGINRPESIAFDATTNALYLSNIVGNGSEKDGNGYIAKVAPDGSSIDSTWLVGLDGPKGVDIGNGKLFAADIDQLIEIDIATAQITARYPAAGSIFLNDVAVAPDGAVYVSDMNTATVWRLKDGVFDKWLEGDAIRSPNGLFAEADRLLIAANGTAIENPGSARYLMAISYADKSVTPLRDEMGIGSLDAIEPDGMGGYILSDWGAGKVMHYTVEAGAREVLQESQGTADLEYVHAQRMLYLPIMMSDRLVAYSTP